MMNGPVVIGGSAGSFRIISKMVSILKPGFLFPLIICVHRNRAAYQGFIPALSSQSAVAIQEPVDGEEIKAGIVYIAPANRHLEFATENTFTLNDKPQQNYSRPSIDVTFNSAATVFGEDLTGILLTGANNDGAEGLKNIHDSGGMTIVQDPAEAEVSVMPQSAMDLFQPAHVLEADKIINFIQNLADPR